MEHMKWNEKKYNAAPPTGAGLPALLGSFSLGSACLAWSRNTEGGIHYVVIRCLPYWNAKSYFVPCQQRSWSLQGFPGVELKAEDSDFFSYHADCYSLDIVIVYENRSAGV